MYETQGEIWLLRANDSFLVRQTDPSGKNKGEKAF